MLLTDGMTGHVVHADLERQAEIRRWSLEDGADRITKASYNRPTAT